ncbi:TVP38/TMEM64 family protein [Halalkalibacillus halophilus]|uniref:TVP38/TMEM64 family protein n=1 Tax=Halalkalibacillus halophilus TaxID=392827 RepID=UPI000404CA77|nr:TVP38/TMEM64 family protein [Halalkalibacillus halophilus]
MAQEDSNLEELEELISDNVIGDSIINVLEIYGSYGPLPGIGLTFIEAFFPMLPILVFIIANTMVYGLFFGFIYSWIGITAGATVVFLLVRKMERFRWVRKIKYQKQIQKVTNFFDRRGFGPLFLILAFPFAPSALINIVAAFTRMTLIQFFLALSLGKAIMVFAVAYVGESITAFTENPVRTIIVGVLVAVFWAVGKVIEKRIKTNFNREEEPKA